MLYFCLIAKGRKYKCTRFIKRCHQFGKWSISHHLLFRFQIFPYLSRSSRTILNNLFLDTFKIPCSWYHHYLVITRWQYWLPDLCTFNAIFNAIMTRHTSINLTIWRLNLGVAAFAISLIKAINVVLGQALDALVIASGSRRLLIDLQLLGEQH